MSPQLRDFVAPPRPTSSTFRSFGWSIVQSLSLVILLGKAQMNSHDLDGFDIAGLEEVLAMLDGIPTSDAWAVSLPTDCESPISTTARPQLTSEASATFEEQEGEEEKRPKQRKRVRSKQPHDPMAYVRRRDRKRAERRELEEKIQEYQKQLKQLEKAAELKQSTVDSDGTTQSWFDIARQQEQERGLSEHVNQRLKRLVHEYRITLVRANRLLLEFNSQESEGSDLVDLSLLDAETTSSQTSSACCSDSN